MSHICIEQLFAALEMADEMIQMADHAGDTCDEDGCLVVSGVIKDCAFKIKAAAERELQALKNRNKLH